MMKRDKYRIIRDILYFVSYQEMVNKTRIVYKCNLNFKNANRILNELQRMELLGIMISGKTSNYFVTEKGLDFLNHYNSALNMMGDFEQEQL